MTSFLLLTHTEHIALLTTHAAATAQSAIHALPQAPLLAGAGASGTPTDIFGAADKIKAAIDKLFSYFLPLGLALCGLYYAWGGLHYITAGSSPFLVQKARTIWWHATVGLVGVILATPIVNTIHGFFQ